MYNSSTDSHPHNPVATSPPAPVRVRPRVGPVPASPLLAAAPPSPEECIQDLERLAESNAELLAVEGGSDRRSVGLWGR